MKRSFFNLPTLKAVEEMLAKPNSFQHLNEIDKNPELQFDKYGNPIYSPSIEKAAEKKKEVY